MNWSISGLIFFSLAIKHLLSAILINKQFLQTRFSMTLSLFLLQVPLPGMHHLPSTACRISTYPLRLRLLPPAWSLFWPPNTLGYSLVWAPSASYRTIYCLICMTLYIRFYWTVSSLRKGLISNSVLNLQHPAQCQGHCKNIIVTANIF